ncbi:MAG: signal recognition particle protein [Bacteroidia bacterium]|nr:MAG: signal recognition particle protein [Bacteroidia bacterium]
MFQTLTEKLEAVFKKLRGQGKITEENVAESLREVRRVLLDADVNLHVAREFIDKVQKRAVGREVLASITPGQQIIKIIHDELVSLLGVSKTDIVEAHEPPTVVLVVGLQGSGKTTFSAKLARFLKGRGRNPLLVAADVYRPAAVDQLVTLGKQLDLPVYSEAGEDAVGIAARSVDFARRHVRDTVIIDTAGRMHVDDAMMNEIAEIKAKTRPHEILFVADAMTGQDAVNTARAFHDRLDFDGVVLTKMDGDSRGGAALSIRAVVHKPIKFIGVGEKLDALEAFHPDRIASRILGMGDIVGLVEKAQEKIDQEKAQRLGEKLRSAQFTLTDFLDQLREVRNMGPLDQVLGMIPGMNRIPAGAQVNEGALTRTEAIIQSMTIEERKRPSIINGSRRKRIAAGSGTTVQEVNRLLKQFEDMQKMMKKLSKGGLKRAMSRL